MLLVSLATRLAVVLADILVLVLTWMKTFGTRREASRIHIEVPMITLLIRDGMFSCGLLLYSLSTSDTRDHILHVRLPFSWPQNNVFELLCSALLAMNVAQILVQNIVRTIHRSDHRNNICQ